MTFFKNVVTKSGGYAHNFLIRLKCDLSYCLSSFCKQIVFHRRMPLKTPPGLAIFSKKRKGAGKKPGNKTGGSAVNSPKKTFLFQKQRGSESARMAEVFYIVFSGFGGVSRVRNIHIIKLSFVCSPKNFSRYIKKP